MVQNSARLSGLPCALADRWLSRVIRALIRADMIKGEPASGPASWALGLGWHGPRLHQLEISLQRTANSHGDAGQWTWVAIAPLRFGHSESMWGFRAVRERVYRSFMTSVLWTRIRAGASTDHTSTSTGKSELEYNVFSIFMFIILGKTSTRVVLAPALTRIWTLLWLAENYDELMAVFLLMIICWLNVPVENRDLWLFPPCLFNLTIASYPSSVHQAGKNLVKIMNASGGCP